MTYLLKQLAYDAGDLGDEAGRDGSGGVVQRRVATLARGGDDSGVLPEAARQAGIREARFVRACLPAETEPLRREDGIGDVDER